jgi:hypothetical protein
MPKKDTATAVLGMLSSTGSQTRPPDEPVASPPPAPIRDTPAPTDTTPAAPIGDTLAPTDTAAADTAAASANRLHAVPPSVDTASTTAPRTLRLRPSTAVRLREAWLQAKRDDVLLTAQDFASDLVDEALSSRRRRRPPRTP